jgi:hypothetical protein
MKKHPTPTVRFEQKHDLEVIPIGTNVLLDIVVDQGFPTMPESFSARFGDAIHNYRCVLDHIAWQLVLHGSDPTPKRPNLVQFPIRDEEAQFGGDLGMRLPGVGRGPTDFIKARHRYQGGKATNEALLRLADLSNDDKHRSLHTVVTAVAQANHQVTFTHCRPISLLSPPEPPKLEPGAVIGHLTIVVTGLDPKVEVVPQLSAYVALEGWSDISDVLTETRTEVTEIINAPQIISAL